ncbi:MAG: hypothetical protein RLZZ499_1749, partial [Cyanobacteriota bacterium]
TGNDFLPPANANLSLGHQSHLSPVSQGV